MSEAQERSQSVSPRRTPGGRWRYLGCLAVVLLLIGGTACSLLPATETDSGRETQGSTHGSPVETETTPTASPVATSQPTTAPQPTKASLAPEPSPTQTRSPSRVAVSSIPQPTGSSTPQPSAFLPYPADRPLSELSEEAETFLSTREGHRGVAVMVPAWGVTYTYNGDQQFPLASVTKILIMVTVMDRAMQEQRSLTDAEIAELYPVITWSDNDAAQSLWNYLGGGATVSETVRRMGLTGTHPSSSTAWGDTTSTPRDVASILAQIVMGDILDQANRELALELLSSIDPSQAWGATAGLPADYATRATVGVKNGWYPGEDGWWVNSAAMIVPGDSHPTYFIAVLTDQQPSEEYGVDTIEGVARQVNASLHE